MFWTTWSIWDKWCKGSISLSSQENKCQLSHYKKKDTSVTFWAERKKNCHTYDTSMTIIVTKPGIIIDVVGSCFYDKKSWQKMGFSSWAGRRHSCMTFFGPSMTGKTVVEARARKISGSSRLRWVVGAERCMEVFAFLSYTHARGCEALGSNWTRARRSPTEPEWLHCRLRITEPERSIDGC